MPRLDEVTAARYNRDKPTESRFRGLGIGAGGGGGLEPVDITSAFNYGDSVTVDVPTHEEGDLLVALSMRANQPDSEPVEAGWNIGPTSTFTTWHPSIRTYSRVATASEPTTYSFVGDGTEDDIGTNAVLLAIPGAASIGTWTRADDPDADSITAPPLVDPMGGLVIQATAVRYGGSASHAPFIHPLSQEMLVHFDHSGSDSRVGGLVVSGDADTHSWGDSERCCTLAFEVV